jgi:SAM-dependent methyltransferase
MASYSRQQLENWLKTIEVKGKVLDIGGSQNPIKGRTAKWEAEEYKILDLETPHECKQKPDIVGDVQCPYLAIEYFEKYFDIAFCLEVSEYWFDPIMALTNIGFSLKNGGILYISLHLFYQIHNPDRLDYLRYTPDGAERILKETGFEIVEHKYRIAEKANMNAIYRQEAMRGNPKWGNVIGSLITAKKIK